MKSDYKNLLLIIVFVFVLGISVDVFAANTTCTGVFSKDLIDALRDYVYKPIKWATPILLLVLTSFDFAGVVFGGKKENMDKAKNNFMKRTVAALIIFFAPDLVQLIVDFIQNQSIAKCLENLK